MRIAWILLAAVVALGCGGGVGNEGAVVGGSCDNADDCVERCLTGGGWPEGTCTVECIDDSDCPAGSSCTDHEGGVCQLDCRTNGECRGGYDCDLEDRRGAPGQVPVCDG